MVIVSMTSYPPRIAGVPMSIRSILEGKVKPDKIVLNLKDPEFPNREKDLPENLLALRRQGLEINWWPRNIRSFAKLVPTLIKHHDDVVVVADDDLVYASDWLSDLLKAHDQSPRDIIASRAHLIPVNAQGVVSPYAQWMQSVHGSPEVFNLMPTTGMGTLYPAHSFTSQVTDESLFMALCPKADDIWIWAMSVLAGTRTRVLKKPFYQVSVPGSQEVALANTNVSAGGNDRQFAAVIERFPEVKAKLSVGFVPNSKKRMFCGLVRKVCRNRVWALFFLCVPLWVKLFNLNYSYAWYFLLGIPVWRRKQFYPKLCVTQRA